MVNIVFILFFIFYTFYFWKHRNSYNCISLTLELNYTCGITLYDNKT